MEYKVQAALAYLRAREESKISYLEKFISENRLTAEQALYLTEAREQLSTQPERVYLLIGDILSESLNENSLKLNQVLGHALMELDFDDMKEYLRYELLTRREADNKLSTLIFKLLQQAAHNV